MCLFSFWEKNTFLCKDALHPKAMLMYSLLLCNKEPFWFANRDFFVAPKSQPLFSVGLLVKCLLKRDLKRFSLTTWKIDVLSSFFEFSIFFYFFTARRQAPCIIVLRAHSWWMVEIHCVGVFFELFAQCFISYLRQCGYSKPECSPTCVDIASVKSLPFHVWMVRDTGRWGVWLGWHTC